MSEHENVRCRQCGSASVLNLGRIPDANLFAGQPLDPAWSGGHLLQCRSCYLGFRDPIHKEEEYEALYAGASDKLWVSHGLRPDQLRIRDFIASNCDAGRVLDVGCYDGTLLRSLGPVVEKFGVEASVSAAHVAEKNGVKIIASRIRDLEFVAESFDVVCAVDVIEHVVDPLAFLAMLTHRLVPGGYLVISTGAIDTAAWRFAGASYWYCAFPEHISFISSEWAASAADKLRLELCDVERFAYSESSTGKLAVARLRFFLNAVLFRFKTALASLLPRLHNTVVSRRSYGYPGVFADHMILVFRKPS